MIKCGSNIIILVIGILYILYMLTGKINTVKKDPEEIKLENEKKNK